jgi:hypothetical protein
MAYTVDDYLAELALRQEAAQQQFGLVVIADVDDAAEPVSLVDAYEHLRIDYDSNGSIDDAWLSPMIGAAREWCEAYHGTAFAPRTLEIQSNVFPTIAETSPPGPYVALPFGPAQSIESITYQTEETALDSNGDPELDTNGDEITEIVTNTFEAQFYTLDTSVKPRRVILAHGASWPSTALDTPGSVRIRYVTGHTAATLPKLARAAILTVLDGMYKQRDGSNFDALFKSAEYMLDLVPGRERSGFA